MFENDLPSRKVGVLTPLPVIDNGAYEFYRLVKDRIMLVMIPVGLSEFSSKDVERVFAPIAWVAPGAVPVTDTAVALARGAPSPHAAMLMIDYLMSQDGQTIYGQLGYGSARQGAERQAGNTQVQKVYIGNRPEFMREFAEWSKLYRDVFLNS